MKDDLSKEEYLVKLFGYDLSKWAPDEWAILDKRESNVGYVQRVEENDTVKYLSLIDENGIVYEDARTENNKSYHFEFERGNCSTVTLDLDGHKKEIKFLTNNSVIRLDWKTNENNYGFTLESINYIYDERGNYQECESVDYIGSYPRRLFVNGKEYDPDLVVLMEKNNTPQKLLYVLDMILSHLPFEMSLEEIIGEEDIEKSGLKPVFEEMNKVKKGSRNK